MSATANRITVDEYYATTIDADWAQLIDGQIVISHPGVRHAVVQARIVTALMTWCDAEVDRGVAFLTTDAVLDEYSAYGPDVIWVTQEHRRDLGERLTRVPDLCVEVRSPSTWRYDLGPKRRGYECGGLPELWLVDDEEQRVTVLRRSRPDAPRFDVELELRVGDGLTSPQLPGFALPLEDLFRP